MDWLEINFFHSNKFSKLKELVFLFKYDFLRNIEKLVFLPPLSLKYFYKTYQTYTTGIQCIYMYFMCNDAVYFIYSILSHLFRFPVTSSAICLVSLTVTSSCVEWTEALQWRRQCPSHSSFAQFASGRSSTPVNLTLCSATGISNDSLRI